MRRPQRLPRQALERALEPLESRRLLSVTTDEQGWTVFGRSEDTRVVYVSNSTGSDANSGLAQDAPVKTLAKARSLLRNGAPDWMLLKRGDVWNESLTSWKTSGRNADEMLVIGAYGSGARPKLNTGTADGFGNGVSPVAHLAIVGIHFHAHTRDTSSPAYAGVTAGGNGFESFGALSNVLIEDAVFDDYAYNLSLTGDGGDITDFTLRRSIITDAWSTTGRAQGIYTDDVHGLVLEENVFDHNGWNERVTGAEANIYSHSVYMSSRNSGVVIRGNIIADSSSHGVQARSGGIIENNVFLRNPLNLLFGGGSPTVKPGGVEGRVTGNVFLDSRSIAGAARGTGVELSNIKPGANVVVANNIFTADTHRNSAAITFGTTSDATNVSEAVGINDLTIRDNIVHDWYSAFSMSTAFVLGGSGNTGVNNLRVIDNDFQETAIQRIVRHGPPINTTQLYWEGNRYHNAFASTGWFQVGSTTTSFDTWKSTAEPSAVAEQVAYDTQGLSVASYSASLGNQASLDAFLAAARGADRRDLDARYTAPAVINYVRAGFAEGGIIPGGSVPTYGAQTADANAPDGAATDPADATGPTATLTVPPGTLTSGGTANHTFTVRYADPTAVDLATIATGDVPVTGPNGYSQNATLISRTSSDNGKTVLAVYAVVPPGGYWDVSDNGTYALSLVSGAARDTLGNTSAAASFGTFEVNVAIDAAPPAVAFQPVQDVTAPGTAAKTFTLTYTDDTGVDLATLGTGDVLVTTTGGGVQVATYVSGHVTNSGKTVVGVYTLAAPGGYWNSTDNGTYQIDLAGSAVADLIGLATSAQPLGTFAVNIQSVDASAPTAVASVTNLTSGGIEPYAFTLTFDDETAVDVASIGAADVIVRGPGGDLRSVTFVSSQSSNDGKTVTATFTTPAPGGYWDAPDNGTYTLSLAAGGVSDVLGQSMAGGSLGAFSVNVPTDTAAPNATVSAAKATGAGETSHTFTVTYADATGVNAITVGAGDLVVTGPGGYSQAAAFISKQLSEDGKTVTAIYSIAARGGEWDYFDNGTYQIALTSGAVSDLRGNATSATVVGTFAVGILDTVAPVASLVASDITSATTQPYSFTITYEDDIGIDLSTVGADDVIVAGPDGASLLVTLASKASTNSGRTVTAVYSVAAPGGSWDGADSGTYRIAMASAQVADVAGNLTGVGTLGTFAVRIGAVDMIAPTASLSASDVTAAGGATYTFDVTYADDVAMDIDTVGTGDVTVAGPNGYSQPAQLVAKTSGDATSVVATYSVPAPGGSWDGGDNGSYQIGISFAAVRDAAGNGIAAASLGSFTVNVPLPPDTSAPTAILSASGITTGGGASHTFSITYADDRAMDATTIGAGDVLVTGPNAFGEVATFVSKQSPDGKTTTAIYSIAAPGDTWDFADNGMYQVSLQVGEVLDAAANPVAAGVVGTFAVSIAPPDTAAPTASLIASNVTASTASHTFTVTYTDVASAIDVSTIGAGDVNVTGPNGYDQGGSVVSMTSLNGGQTLSVVYAVPAAGGSWDFADNGIYSVALAADAVRDIAGNATPAATLGSFAVNVAAAPVTITLGTSTSAYVRDGSNANTNYGSSAQLEVKRAGGKGNTREAYLRFDITSITDVTAAKLRLRGALNTSGSVAVVVYGSGNTTWTESGLTWNTRPSTNTAALATKTLTSTGYALHEWDVTAYLQQLKSAGATAVTFVLRGRSNTSPYASFRSDEYATTTERPQLVVTQGATPPPPPTTPSLVLSRSTMFVGEGSSGTFTVALASAPASNVTVNVARQSGDADLTGAPQTLAFTPANWSVPQTVTVAAAQDADALAGQATFAVSASGTTTRTVDVTEIDDDVPPVPQPITIVSTVATYVRDGTYATQNFGTASELIVKRSISLGNTRETYMRFDLGSVVAPNITSAKLRLYGRLSTANAPTLTADVYSSTNTTWSETTTTWNTKPVTGTTKLGSITIGATTSAWYEVDLTAFVQAELAAGRKLVTLALKPVATSDPYLIFASDETANGPQLVVAS